MIVVRDVFHLKFGAAREATALWREGTAMVQRMGFPQGPPRMLVDRVARYYTLVLESGYASLTEYEQTEQQLQKDAEWKTWYQRFVPLVEGGYREIFTVL
jgi:predicted thioredoxin/glutaredoxin